MSIAESDRSSWTAAARAAKAARPGDRWLAWTVFLVLLAAYLATFSGLPDNPDAEVEFQTASALVRNQSFALGGTPEADAIVGIEHQGRQGFNVRRGRPGRENEFFGWSGVGQALFAFPFYILGSFAGQALPGLEERHAGTTHLGVARSEYFEHVVVGLRNPLLGALTGALVTIAARHLGARRRNALLAGLSYGLCTLAWPQARGTLSDVQATAFLFLAFVLAQQALDRVARGKDPRSAVLLGFGLALGGAFLTRAVIAPGVAVLALYLAFELRRGLRGRWLRPLALAYLPALGCFGAFLWINKSRFGEPLETGYGGVVDVGWFLRSPGTGVAGVLVSPGSGLLWFAPGLLVFLVWALGQLQRRKRRLLALLAAMILALGVPNTVIPSWHGAWSYGPRYLLPLIPFLWFPIGVVLGNAWPRPLARTLVLATFVLGGLTALAGVLVEYNTNLDLSLQAARMEWPSPPGPPGSELIDDDARFVRTKFDWRFAAPWAHWRIFRHRAAGLGEEFSVRELYYLDRDDTVRPQWEREQGFNHLYWVDLAKRLGGPSWPGPVLCLALLVGASVCLRRAREES